MFEYFEKQGMGYDGWSMSNNARSAYANDKRPLSRWTKSDILDVCENLAKLNDIELDYGKLSKLNLFTLKQLLVYSEWHHTGKFFNRTDFYEVSLDRLQGLIERGYPNQQAPAKAKSVQDFDDGYCHGYYVEKIFHPYSRWNRYEEKQVSFANARTKGEWLYLADGSRKALKKVVIEKRTKIKRRKK